MRIWVPGSRGQIGHVLLQTLQKMGIDCFGTTHAEVDISDEKQTLVCASGVSHIINAAGFANVELAEKNRDEAFRANARGPEILAKAAKEVGARLIHLSTDYVFDGKLGRFYREEDETNPLNWYGETKRMGEFRLLEILPEGCILRVSTVYGGEGDLHFVSQVNRLIRQNKELYFVEDEVGRVTYVPDLVKAIIALLDKNGIYHFSNLGAVSKYAFANWIWEAAKKRDPTITCQKILPVSSAIFRHGIVRPLYTPLDTKKIEALLKIRPWEEALEEYFIRYYQCTEKMDRS